MVDPVPQHRREYRSRISPFQRAQIETRIQAAWQAGNSVDHAFASAWDEGLMFASRRSWWRIGAHVIDQSARPVVPTRRRGRVPREAPVLRAFGPNEVWSWDITDLRSPWRGQSFKAYSIIDIYSRKLVGWRVEQRESDHLAVEMFATAIATHGAPVFVHADSGPAMRSSLLADFLHENAITQSHNRPHVSNDNPVNAGWILTPSCRSNVDPLSGLFLLVRSWCVSPLAVWCGGRGCGRSRRRAR
jgi:transposase InsO family protein